MAKSDITALSQPSRGGGRGERAAAVFRGKVMFRPNGAANMGRFQVKDSQKEKKKKGKRAGKPKNISGRFHFPHRRINDWGQEKATKKKKLQQNFRAWGVGQRCGN